MSTEDPRPASPPWQNALRTGGVGGVLAGVAYLVVQAKAVPPFAAWLGPEVATSDVGKLVLTGLPIAAASTMLGIAAWLGSRARDAYYAGAGVLAKWLGRVAPVLLVALGLGCASTLEQRVYAAGLMAAAAQEAANAELVARCSPEVVSLDPSAQATCADLAERNAEAQSALDAAVTGASSAALWGGDLEGALVGVHAALCRVYLTFPGLMPPPGAPAPDCAYDEFQP